MLQGPHKEVALKFLFEGLDLFAKIQPTSDRDDKLETWLCVEYSEFILA